jgi:hypothetical protein
MEPFPIEQSVSRLDLGNEEGLARTPPTSNPVEIKPARARATYSPGDQSSDQ